MVFESVFLVHSHNLHGQTRKLSVQLIDEHLSPLSKKGTIVCIDAHEADDQLVKMINDKIVDVDPNKMKVIRPDFEKHVRSLHIRQLSNALKHHEAIKKVATYQNDSSSPSSSSMCKYSLILEDDAMFSKNVADIAKTVITNAPMDADIIFMSLPSPCGEDSPIFHDTMSLFQGCIPACDAYAITRSAAEKLASAMLPIRMSTNMQITFLIQTLSLKTYVSNPNVFIDGSKLGVYTSSIETNNKLIWNQSYCAMEEIIKSVTIPVEEKKELFTKALTNQPFGEHPDMLYMHAKFLTNIGMYTDARKEYEKAMQMYERDRTLMNNSSEFLRDYMSLFKHFQ